MSKIPNRSLLGLFGFAGGGGGGDVSIAGPPVQVNSVSRFATTDGKNIKGSGNQLTFDGTLFAVRDSSDEVVFGVDVDAKLLNLSAVNLVHTNEDTDLFLKIFEKGDPADADNSSLQMGWDEAGGKFVLQTVKNGAGVLRDIGIIAPSVTVNGQPITDTDTINVVFADTGNLGTGSFMKVGEVICNGSPAWIAPFDYNLKKISIARTDTDLSDIEVLVEGIVVDTIATAAISVTAALTSSVQEGEGICIRNKATGNIMTNVIVSLVLEMV